MVGDGYTLFLPWGTYKPGICAVHLKLKFEQDNKMPMYADSGPLTLDNQLEELKPPPVLQTNAAKKETRPQVQTVGGRM